MAINCPTNISKNTSDFTLKINHCPNEGTKQTSEQIRDVSNSELTEVLKGPQRSLSWSWGLTVPDHWSVQDTEQITARKNPTNISNDKFNRNFNQSTDLAFEQRLAKIFEILDSTRILNVSDITNLIMNCKVGDHWSVQDLGLFWGSFTWQTPLAKFPEIWLHS